MSLSVVVPVYNEEKYLERTLESIKNQKFKDFEVIVVCNGCTDKSFEIAKNLFRKNVHEKIKNKVFNLKEGNVSKARNFGAARAKSEFLVFLDADTVMDEDVLGGVNEVMLRDRYFGSVKGKGEGFRNQIYLRFKNSLNKFFPWGHGFVFCDKKSFFDVGGFNPELKKGELNDFYKRINVKYKRVNVYVEPSDRRVRSWGLGKLIKCWLVEGKGKKYEAVR